jgi:hypothetical protein
LKDGLSLSVLVKPTSSFAILCILTRLWYLQTFPVNNQGCTRLAAASDKDYQLLAQGRWFPPGTPASSTTKTGRHDIAEILLKVALLPKFKFKQTNLSLIDSVLVPINNLNF